MAGQDHYVLSAGHVLTPYNRLAVGDAVIQPGKSDRGKPSDKVAELSHVIELQFRDHGFPNLADAALARITGKNCLPEDFDSLAPIAVERGIRRGSTVQMTGRTSGLSLGRTMDVSARIEMRYPRDAHSSGRVGFADVVLCTPFTKPGDSGALVTTESGKAVGLIIGGSSKASVFCKVGNVFDLLGIDAMRLNR
ncbi:hypothetical protein [Novosphingobium sp. AAP93]|uniref:trypsin-like peptidase domain-containing protein n=1 Tax=Novosphingobium sp. AAP93 TaxID=1523427 RepID=UPI0012E1FF72|nr:hypothetical protein [Novosphingobium sp. AAP93]